MSKHWLATTALVLGCGSSAGPVGGSMPGADAAPGVDGAQMDSSVFSGITAISFGREVNGRCLPEQLPPNCHLVLLAVRDGCGQPGLSPASPADQALIAARFMALPPGDNCQVNELMGNCTDQPTAGWCYVHSSCSPSDPPCPQAVCASSGFLLAVQTDFFAAVLICP